jgi:hypothetical protein
MTLWFALNVWREELMLPGALDSIRRFFPDAKIVAVDGVYKSVVEEVRKLQAAHIIKNEHVLVEQLEPFTEADSKDRTYEILDQYKVDVIIKPETDSGGGQKPWENECIKRSKYFVGTDGDYYFVLDADERVVGSFDYKILTHNAYNIMLKRTEDTTVPYRVMRIHKHVDGMRYYGAHHALWIGETLYTKKMCETVQGVLIEHHQDYRVKKEPIRNMVKGAYYRVLTSEVEGAFRSQHSL